MVMTEKRRNQRHQVMFAIFKHGMITKQQITNICGGKTNADAWLADNSDLPFHETENGAVKIAKRRARS